MSLQQVFPRRNLTVDDWRKSQMLSLVASPSQMLNPAQTETVRMLFSEVITENCVFYCIIHLIMRIKYSENYHLFLDIMMIDFISEEDKNFTFYLKVLR